jgi:hypothetical protein
MGLEDSQRTPWPLWSRILAGASLLGVVAVFLAATKSSTAPTRGVSKPEWVAQTETTKGVSKSGYVSCTTESALDRTVTLSSDPVALAKFVADEKNGCVALKAGLSVVIDQVKAGKRQIRLPGSATSTWTVAAAVE